MTANIELEEAPQKKEQKICRTVEDLYEIIGGFGRFQIFALVTTLFPEFPASMVDFQPVFTSSAHHIQWICTDQLGRQVDVTNDSLALCSCNGTLNGGHGSIVSEWGLVCDWAWVPDFITSIQMMGLVIGDILGVYLTDSMGRKKVLYIAGFITMFGSMCSSVATTIVLYAVTRFLCGIGISIVLLVASIYPMELLTPKWRSISGAAGAWHEGCMCLALFAYNFPSWRHLCFVTALPMLLLFVTYPFLPESPRFLLMKGRTERTKKVFRQIARFNKSPPLDDQLVEDLAATFENDNSSVSNEGADKFKMLSVLKDAEFMKKTLIFMSSWFSCLLLYYGIAFNAKNLSGDPYWNVFYMALVDMIGGNSAIFISKWLGRKLSFGLYMGIATTCMINIILMETLVEGAFFVWPIKNSELTFNISVLGGKMMAAAAYAVINCFCSESYPTTQRSLGVGAANVAASCAAILAPQMAYFGTLYATGPYYIFTVASFSSTIMILFLCETNGKPLNENS